MTEVINPAHTAVMEYYKKEFQEKKKKLRKEKKKQEQKEAYFNRLPLAHKAFFLKHVSPQGFYPWDLFATDILWQMKRNDKNTSREKKDIKMKWLKAPAYYLTKELAQAFIHTPVNTLRLEEEPHTINHEFIIFQPTELNGTRYTQVNVMKKNSKHYLHSDTVRINFHGNYSTEGLIKESDSNSKSSYLSAYGNTLPKKLRSNYKVHFSWREFSKAKVKYDDFPQCKKDQFNIVVNMILFLNQQPDITVEEYDAAKTIPLNSSPEKKIIFKPRAITWVGKNFNQRVIRNNSNSEELIVKQTGQPIRSHWRRGHWHTVCRGPKRRERKLRWYLPVFVIGRGSI